MGILVNEFIQRYFASERQTVLLNVSLGLLMIAAAAVLRQWSAAGSVQRGAAYPLVAIGLLLSVSACAYVFTINQRSTSIVQGYKGLSDTEVASRETARLEKVVNHSYTGAFWICGVLMVSGLVLGSMSGLSSFRGGIASGLVLAALLVMASEIYSKQKNMRFLRELQGCAHRH